MRDNPFNTFCVHNADVQRYFIVKPSGLTLIKMRADKCFLNGRTLDKRINMNGGIHNFIACLLSHTNLILMSASRNPASPFKIMMADYDNWTRDNLIQRHRWAPQTINNKKFKEHGSQGRKGNRENRARTRSRLKVSSVRELTISIGGLFNY